MSRARYDDAFKERAVALAVEHGPAEAARKVGVKAGTVRAWCSRAGVATVGAERTEAATKAAHARWEERRSAMVHDIGAAAELALTKTTEHLRGGHLRNAKDAATTMAILIDKAQLLSGGHTARFGTDADRASVLTEAHGKGLSLVSDAA